MTTNATFKMFTDKMGGTRANNYIGTTGEVFYDVDGSTPLRLSDGVTPGGIPFGISSGSTSFNPQFRSNTGNTLAGTVSTGSYIKQGSIVHLRINVDFANTTQFDTANNQYQFTLPFPAASTITIRGGTLHQKGPTAANVAIYHIAGITDIEDGGSNTTMNLYYSGSTTDLAWKYSTPVNATSNTSHFDLSGSYETTSTVVA
jgi:hypothetical protein